MSLESLYNINDFNSSEGEFSASISFDPTHKIFTGHFPGQPVVPGVCLIHIIKEITGMLTKIEMLLTDGSNIKFLHVINPLEYKEVQIKGTSSSELNNQMKIIAQIFIKDIVFFKFNGSFNTETMKQ